VVVSDKVDLLSYASILLNVGFANPAGVAQAVAQWRQIHDQVRPDRIVLDTAPVAQLAACLHRWPAIRVSNGFDAPPADCPSFGIRMRGPYIDRLNAQHVSLAESALASIARKVGIDVAPTLADHLTFPRRFFDCIPQADPYGERDDVTYIGPLSALPGCEEPAWPEGTQEGRVKVFAYLRASPMTEPLLGALADIGANVLCVSGGQAFDVPTSSAGPIRVTRRPVNLTSAVRQADLVVSYAPLGLLSRARIEGKPQLLAPIDTEKVLGARRQQSSGAAVIVERADAVPRALATAMQIAVPPVAWSEPVGNWMCPA
jgi:UDP:flavonoid glycosyltransferase YjiC (YdhE family)